jgi:hypothetical protein
MRNKGQFTRGSVPWNKGLRGFDPSPETHFRSGKDHAGESHPSWKGGVQVMKNDCTYLWDQGKRVRRPRKIYEEFIGAIPKGYVVVHRDGDRYNDSPDNLEVISRAENLKRNRHGNK